MTTHYAPNARETFNARTAEHNAAIAALTLTPPQRRAVHAVATGTDQFTPGDHVQLIGPSWLEAGMLGHVITITETAKGGGYFASEPSEEWYVEAETGSQYEGTLVTIHPKTTDAESRARAERIAAEHFPYDGTEPDTVTEGYDVIRAALAAFRDASELASNLSADATDADDMLNADHIYEEAARAFAPVAARFLADRLGVTW